MMTLGKSSLQKLTFEWKSEGSGVSHVDIWEKSIPVNGKSVCKGPGAQALLEDGDWWGGGNVVGGQRDRRVKCAGKREAGVMGCVI